MRLSDLLRMLEVTDPDGELGAHWQDTVSTLPRERPEFLQPERIREWRRFCRLAPEVEPVLLRVAGQIDRDSCLRAFAWHLYRRLYIHVDSGGFASWPSLTRHTPEAPDAIYLLACMAAVPGTVEAHRRLGVAPEVTRDTMLQVSCFAANYADATGGAVGVLKEQVYWLRHYPAGRLFRIGRFEFMVQPFRGRVRVFRHRTQGQVVALSEDGVDYDPDGYIPIRGTGDCLPGFRARLELLPEAVVGNVVSPRGVASPHRVRLPLSEWEPVLTPGDATLDMHIPSGGGMTPQACHDALARAFPFFARTFPDRPVSTVSCFSWIYNPEFEAILGGDANLVKHLREMYLFPIESSGRDGLFFLFYADNVDPRTARRDTSIRRAVLDHLSTGRPLRSSGMFALARDLGGYGSAMYRRDWPGQGLPGWLVGLQV